MTDKFYVVEHTFRVIHRGEPGEPEEGTDYPDGLAWHFEENLCSQNVVHALERLCEANPGYCSTCAGHRGKFIQRFDTLEEALCNPTNGAPCDISAIDLEMKP